MSEALDAVLERSRALGFLGPGPAQDQRRHAEAFVEVLGDATGTIVDLGSGGGVPGLVVAVALPACRLVLLDSIAKRCRFLEWAIAELGLDATVYEGRAEDAGRGDLRGTATAVLARSFGPPAVAAECAAPLLADGGRVIVSEPPGGGEGRWPAAGLARLGLGLGAVHTGPPTIQVLDQVAPCPATYPRRSGIPAKRPLF